MGRDIADRPEVEGEGHRIAVLLAKQWLDVLLEVHRLILRCGCTCHAAAGREATDRAPAGEVRSERVRRGGQRTLRRFERAPRARVSCS
ncbi:hypothetical protein AB0383_45345 [Amycolatopsis sp. NPDC051373]|uniref:hypothetical protein n=1 Tax=Amycolatopsis sp. NPDC051373 TaxID=3155801 RepID=UPI00344DB88A